MDAIAAAAIAFRKAAEPAFQQYDRQILANAAALADALSQVGVTLVTGGTSNHMIVVDTVASFAMDGKQAEELLDRTGIATNKQVIPDDPKPPLGLSGIRIGTPACTTRGMQKPAMRRIAAWIADALRNPADAPRHSRLAAEVKDSSAAFPIPGFDSLPW
jgi:glycine hydroxymethyltransferase